MTSKAFLALIFAFACFVSHISAAPNPFHRPVNVAQVFLCTPATRLGDVCVDIYQPVCGYRPDLNCLTTPCNHITYPNRCEACHDSDVVSYTKGECTELD